jgi:MOSC domain-containing protein YiiM
MTPTVVAVHSSRRHDFSKEARGEIVLIEGHGVSGDAHFGKTVQHLSRVAKDPTQLNLRQVHLIHQELLDELRDKGFEVAPGELGENVTTRGIGLLELAAGTRLRLGAEAIVEVTGLRNPCAQIERFQSGLLAAVLDRAPGGALVRKSGVMGIVVRGGVVKPGDTIALERLPHEHVALQPV